MERTPSTTAKIAQDLVSLTKPGSRGKLLYTHAKGFYTQGRLADLFSRTVSPEKLKKKREAAATQAAGVLGMKLSEGSQITRTDVSGAIETAKRKFRQLELKHNVGLSGLNDDAVSLRVYHSISQIECEMTKAGKGHRDIAKAVLAAAVAEDLAQCIERHRKENPDENASSLGDKDRESLVAIGKALFVDSYDVTSELNPGEIQKAWKKANGFTGVETKEKVFKEVKRSHIASKKLSQNDLCIAVESWIKRETDRMTYSAVKSFLRLDPSYDLAEDKKEGEGSVAWGNISTYKYAPFVGNDALKAKCKPPKQYIDAAKTEITKWSCFTKPLAELKEGDAHNVIAGFKAVTAAMLSVPGAVAAAMPEDFCTLFAAGHSAIEQYGPKVSLTSADGAVTLTAAEISESLHQKFTTNSLILRGVTPQFTTGTPSEKNFGNFLQLAAGEAVLDPTGVAPWPAKYNFVPVEQREAFASTINEARRQLAVFGDAVRERGAAMLEPSYA